MTIRKAIFPVAGLGTRFLPATKAQPKEMLTVVDKPLIQYAVEEAYAAGIRQMIFVTGRNKRAIEDHFDANPELERALADTGKDELLAILDGVVPDDLECVFIRQSNPLGLGHAVLCAKSVVGKENFAVLLADDLMVADKPVLSQMMEAYSHLRSSIIAVQEVPLADTGKYGIVATSSYRNNTLGVTGITGMVEKPQPSDAPSTKAVVGRYLLSNSVMDELAKLEIGSGEMQLTDAISNSIVNSSVFAFDFEGERFDCGSKLGFLKAQVCLGSRHPEVGDDFRKFLADMT